MNLTRRSFLHASLMAGGLVAVPQFGRWFRPPGRRLYQVMEVKVAGGIVWHEAAILELDSRGVVSWRDRDGRVLCVDSIRFS